MNIPQEILTKLQTEYSKIREKLDPLVEEIVSGENLPDYEFSADFSWDKYNMYYNQLEGFCIAIGVLDTDIYRQLDNGTTNE